MEQCSYTTGKRESATGCRVIVLACRGSDSTKAGFDAMMESDDGFVQ